MGSTIPFGTADDRWNCTYDAIGLIQLPAWFAAQGAGVLYYGRRYYSPALGRFINRDPIEEQGGLSLYAFCLNNPINGWDVLGQDTFTRMQDDDGNWIWVSAESEAYVDPVTVQSIIASQGGGYSGLNYTSNLNNTVDTMVASNWAVAEANEANQRQRTAESLAAISEAAAPGLARLNDTVMATVASQGAALVNAVLVSQANSLYAAATASSGAQVSATLMAAQAGATAQLSAQIASQLPSTSVTVGGLQVAGAWIDDAKPDYSSALADTNRRLEIASRPAAQHGSYTFEDGWNVATEAALAAQRGAVGFTNQLTFGLTGTSGVDPNDSAYKTGRLVGGATQVTMAAVTVGGLASAGTPAFYSGMSSATAQGLAAARGGYTVGMTMTGSFVENTVQPAVLNLFGTNMGSTVMTAVWRGTSAAYAVVSAIKSPEVLYFGNGLGPIWTSVEKPILRLMGTGITGP